VPNAVSDVCSDHFKQSDFYKNNGGNYKVSLKNEAISLVFKTDLQFTLHYCQLNCFPANHKKKIIISTFFHKLKSYPTGYQLISKLVFIIVL